MVPDRTRELLGTWWVRDVNTRESGDTSTGKPRDRLSRRVLSWLTRDARAKKPKHNKLPERALAWMCIEFRSDGCLSIGSPINCGHGRFEVDERKNELTLYADFTDVSLGGVGGDDRKGTMRRAYDEGESIMCSLPGLGRRFSVGDDGGVLDIIWRNGSGGETTLTLVRA